MPDFFKKKELENLEYEVKYAYERYREEAKEIAERTKKVMSKLNALIGTVNAERHNLREEIYALHDFLSKFNDIGRQLTPVDFEVEPYHDASGQELAGGMAEMPVSSVDSEKVAGKIAKWVLLPPIVAAPHEIFELFRKRHKMKKQIENRTFEFNQMKAEWSKDVREREQHLHFCQVSTEIANIYRICIATVKDAIKKHILPELRSVYCFFITDAMKENVIYGNEISDVRPNPIVFYQNTQYNKHYLFVKNVFDLHLLICEIFTRSLLAQILEDETISHEVETEYINGINNIRKQFGLVKENVTFVEWTENEGNKLSEAEEQFEKGAEKLRSQEDY